MRNPRQCIQRQRHHFADTGPSNQSYIFSRSHVQMWEIGHKDCWALKNWSFQLCCWKRLLRIPWTARRSNLSIVKKINPEYWRRKWQPTPVFLPGKSHGRRSLVGYSPWGRKELDTTEWFHTFTHIHWKDWCWSWSSNALATYYEELTHWKRPWCWERLRTGGERGTGDEMVGWHYWLSEHEFEQTPGDSERQGSLVLQSIGSQSVEHNWVTKKQQI